MNLNKRLNESIDGLKSFTSLNESANTYEVKYNESAIQRTYTPIQTDTITGTRDDLMEFLDSICVDECQKDDGLKSFDEWVADYEELYDPSGSTVVLSIKENGKEIYRNSDYDSYAQKYGDDYDDED